MIMEINIDSAALLPLYSRFMRAYNKILVNSDFSTIYTFLHIRILRLEEKECLNERYCMYSKSTYLLHLCQEFFNVRVNSNYI